MSIPKLLACSPRADVGVGPYSHAGRAAEARHYKLLCEIQASLSARPAATAAGSNGFP